METLGYWNGSKTQCPGGLTYQPHMATLLLQIKMR